jgi:hypothetical protein
MALRQAKMDASLRRLDTLFGSPSSQMRGFPNRERAKDSAATLLSAQMNISYRSALDVVEKWYRERGV